MKAIVAVYKDWGIGSDGKMMHNIPEDMKFFREKTMNKVVVMGRKTLESFPNKAPLKNRVNIVLTQNKCFQDDRLIICNSVDEALVELEKYDEDDIYIIGGEMIYKIFLSYCDEIFVTKIDYKYSADTYFTDLDKDENWYKSDNGEIKEHSGIKYRYETYRNKNFGSVK